MTSTGASCACKTGMATGAAGVHGRNTGNGEATIGKGVPAVGSAEVTDEGIT